MALIRLNNLPLLRFLVASYIIAFHYFDLPNSNFLSIFFSHGHIGVPFFFLLSGFVLSYNYENKSFINANDRFVFWRNRFVRIAPIYYVSMIVATPLIVVGQFNGAVLSMFENIYYILGHVLFLQAIIPTQSMVNFWNIHSWALSVEIFLYLIFPYLIILIQKASVKKLLFMLIASFVLNLGLFILSLPPFLLFQHISKFFALLYIPTFVIGIILAKLYLTRLKDVGKYSFHVFVFSMMIIGTLLLVDLDSKFYSNFNPIIILLFSLIILSACYKSRLDRMLKTSTGILLGEIAYAMYMLQAPVKFVVQQFLSKVIGYEYHDGLIYFLVIYFSIIGCSIVLAKMIEPLIRVKLRNLLVSKT